MLHLVQIGPSETDTLNDQLRKLCNNTILTFQLTILRKLTDEELKQLEQFIITQRPFPCAKLTLTVDLPTLTTAHCLDVLRSLNTTLISGIELIFTTEEVKQCSEKIEEALNIHVAPTVYYPVYILESGEGKIVPTQMKLAHFQEKLILNIQKRHKENLLFAPRNEATTAKGTLAPDDPMNKKFKYKSLIQSRKKNTGSETAFPSTLVEVQHVATVQQQNQMALVQETVLEQKIELQLHLTQQYRGELLGFEDFSKPRYKDNVLKNTQDGILTDSLYAVLEQELFANWPHAIKFISPTAAEELSFNLPEFVTLNKDNLPNGFIVKETQCGELVLDFDPYLENERTNPFTPVAFNIDPNPIFSITLEEQDVRHWIDDQQIADLLCPADTPYTTPVQLVNLWIKYGNEGVATFFMDIKLATLSNPKFALFLFSHYLMHLPQWDQLHNNSLFFQSIERVSRYNEERLLCLKRFLESTGTSRHHFIKTVSAFDHFWSDLLLLCAAQQVSVAGINKHPWSMPKHGNPVVFMERMQCILKNARTLQEQFELLKGITLDNYGAYYASCFEGFTTVSVDMAFEYDRETENKKAFSIDRHVHREHLPALYEKYPKLTINYLWHASIPKEIGACFRFIGTQNTGITVLSLRDQLASYADGALATLMPELMAMLLFVSHERYIENEPLSPLFRLLNTCRSYREMMRDVMRLLKELYQLDIKLNQQEGVVLFNLINNMDGTDFDPESLSQDGETISKKRLLMQLVTQLKKNKWVVFRCLNLRVQQNWPMRYAFDTAEFLATDPLIASTYDDLLLFSDLINGHRPEAYDHARLESLQRKETSDIAQPTLVDSETSVVETNINTVRHYLHQAASQEKPNNLQYAIRQIIGARNYFKYADFISVCSEIQLLTVFDSNETDRILRRHQFNLDTILPEFLMFSSKNNGLNNLFIALIIYLQDMPMLREKNSTGDILPDEDALLFQRRQKLCSLSNHELQEEFNRLWNKLDPLSLITFHTFVHETLKNIRDSAIRLAFASSKASGILKTVSKKIRDLRDFQNLEDIMQVNEISLLATKIAELLRDILKNTFVQTHEKAFIDLFETIDFSKFDYKIFYRILLLLRTMPERNYLALLKTLFTDDLFIANEERLIQRIIQLIDLLERLHLACFSSNYLDAFSKIVIANPEQQGFDLIVSQMIIVHTNKPQDPILAFLMSDAKLTYETIRDVLQLSESIAKYRDKVGVFLIYLAKSKKLSSFLEQIISAEAGVQKQILEILSKGHALNRGPIEYERITAFLMQLPQNELELLAEFYQKRPINTEAFLGVLIKLSFKKPDNFQAFLLEFEKTPFGARDFTHQFSTSEVERVINRSSDLLNKTPYPYQYRKQMMECFLFVNEIGQNLPVYYNKTAKDLTNSEIKTYFNDLKANRIAHLTPIERCLMALGLMREAMYRSTGEFPSSTQIIALIDSIMHPGNCISNINTGEGKSLMDFMRAVLLLFNSLRVDITTSSLIDAERDIEHYGPFFEFLDIPYSELPISSASPFSVFQKEGINLSTFSQLSLFFAKARVMGVVLDNPDTVVSLVVNESDYTLLDDRVIYRFAVADGSGIGYGQEWIYYAINEFVSRKAFIENEHATARDDIDDLKAYLKATARELKKSGKSIDKFSDEQCSQWIKSAIAVIYDLKENKDYVIPDEFQKKVIGEKEVLSKVVKVLMKDNKVSPDATFGNDVQQLLYARLNKELGGEHFRIEPPPRTLISMNNRKVINDYIRRCGFIWGSSGTVGSEPEIQEQYAKYGFDFSKIEPHQKSQVVVNKPIIAPNEAAQFKQLITLLTAAGKHKGASPSLVFCKDIDTAIRLFKEFETQNPNKIPVQSHTGFNEKEHIRIAAQSRVITITTSALGRNTDIKYDRVQGLRVYHTFVDSIRGMGQKSGRTGRQGSAGEVNFVFNAEELGKKTPAQIQEIIDHGVALERRTNEELYNVLGYLLTQVDLLPDAQFIKGKPAFLCDSWAPFSHDTETQFRESYEALVYNKEAFIKKTLASFNTLLNTALKVPVEKVTFEDINQVTEKIHPSKVTYKPYQQEVKLRDCTPPVAIAYRQLPFAHEEAQPTETKAKIQKEINKLFDGIEKNTFVAKNKEYLAYLIANPTTQEVLIEAHNEFLITFLQNHSRKLNTAQPWLGAEGNLNKMASNPNYLLLFHVLTSIPNNRFIELEVIKRAIHTLLTEYLETGWSISVEQRTAVTVVTDMINRATDANAVIAYLSQVAIETAKQNIETNKHRTWASRYCFGDSYYLTVLSRAVNLVASLNGTLPCDEIRTCFVRLPVEATHITECTLDELKIHAESAKKDSANASEILNTLEEELTIKEPKALDGMIGRMRFFRPAATATNPSRTLLTEPSTGREDRPHVTTSESQDSNVVLNQPPHLSKQEVFEDLHDNPDHLHSGELAH